jgi:fumarate reductase subunit C
MILSIMSELEDKANDFKEWIEHNDNPMVMIILFVGLFLLFVLGFKSLHKHD